MKRIGLVLSGGGAKGFSHIGILKVLDELKVRPTHVSGCSMGAIIGALYCLGYSGKQIERKIDEITVKRLIKMLINHKTKNSRIEDFLDKLFEGKNFEDLRTPLYVNATDLNTGEEIIFNKGSLAKAVRASIAIPFIFKPTVVNGRVLVDGGVTNNLPIQILRDQQITKIISVNTNSTETKKPVIEEAIHGKRGKKPPALMKSLAKSISIIQSNPHITKFYRQKSSLLITPKLEEFNLLDFTKKKKIMKAGEKEARKNIRKIREIFKSQMKSQYIKELFKDYFKTMKV